MVKTKQGRLWRLPVSSLAYKELGHVHSNLHHKKKAQLEINYPLLGFIRELSQDKLLPILPTPKLEQQVIKRFTVYRAKLSLKPILREENFKYN